MHVLGADTISASEPLVAVDAARRAMTDHRASLLVVDDLLALCMLCDSSHNAMLAVRRVAALARSTSLPHGVAHDHPAPVDARLHPRSHAHTDAPTHASLPKPVPMPVSVSVLVRLVGACDVAVRGGDGTAAWAPVSLLRYATSLATQVVTVQPLASGYSREVRGRMVVCHKPTYARGDAVPQPLRGTWAPSLHAPAATSRDGVTDNLSTWVATPPPTSRLFTIGPAGGGGGSGGGVSVGGREGTGLVRAIGESTLVMPAR